jgi:hypothetical protein
MSAGETLPRKPKELNTVEDVTTMRDVINWAIKRLGCEWPTGDDWKKNSIILSYSGYEAKELAQVIEWCAATGKHPAVPWKVIVWVDAFHEDQMPLLINDPIQQRLDEIYVHADSETRKRIRAVSGTPDKRAAMALLKELRNA